MREIVLDTETTGLGADARAIELGLVFLDSMGRVEGEFGTLLRGDANTTTKHERDQRDTIAAKHTTAHGCVPNGRSAMFNVNAKRG